MWRLARHGLRTFLGSARAKIAILNAYVPDLFSTWADSQHCHHAHSVLSAIQLASAWIMVPSFVMIGASLVMYRLALSVC